MPKNMANYTVPSDYSPIANFGALMGGALPNMGQGSGLPQMGEGQSAQGGFPFMGQANNAPGAASANSSLVKVAQELLMKLGYNPGNVSGQMTDETKIAIATFQAKNKMAVDATVTPQLIGVLTAKVDEQGAGGATASLSDAGSGNALQAAQQACLEEAIAEAQAKKKKKKGFGSLMSAVSKTANLLGNNKFVTDLATTTNEIYQVDSTVKDYKKAAKELGISKEAVENCQNPQ